jgi:hypothetical protein
MMLSISFSFLSPFFLFMVSNSIKGVGSRLFPVGNFIFMVVSELFPAGNSKKAFIPDYFINHFKKTLTIMVKQKAIIDFSKYEADEIDETAGTIHNKLVLNAADFPGLPVPMAAFLILVNNYHAILIAPLYDDQTADLKAARALLEEALRDNGNQVNIIAKGDDVLLSKSGYPLSKLPAPIGQLLQAKFKKVTSINKGFEIEIEKVEHAEGYLVFTCLSANPAPEDISDWKWHYFPKTKGSISNLSASTKYRIICVGLGTDPNLIANRWSEQRSSHWSLVISH